MEKKKGKVKEVSTHELRSTLAKKDERRSSERVDARLEIDVPLATWEQVRRVYTTNISHGGLLFSLTSPTAIPAEISITLTLPDHRTVTLKSEVRHVERRAGTAEFDVGVQFQPLDEQTKQTFEQALAGLGKHEA
jgi:c-di-GMP-binding flagellar brake protein YcgR